MPQFLEAKLRTSFANQKAKGKLKGVNKDEYVYGGMNSVGAMRGSKTTAKGKRMEKKHQAKMHGPSRKLSELA